MASLTWIVSSCVLLLAVVALRAVFGKRIRLETRYLLWGLVLLRLLLPFEIGQSAWSVASVVQRAEWTRLSENFTALPDVDVTNYAGDNTGAASGVKDPGDFSAERPALPAEKPAERVPDAVRWQDVLRRVWYGGMAIATALFLASNLLFYLRLCRRRVPLEIDCKLKIYSVENLSSSCLFLGAVYVSAETVEDSTKLRHVLAHELAHHRHLDGVWALLRCAAVTLHWYNPLVWWASALARRDSELFADEGALKSLGDGEREDYGVTLIKLSARQPAAASLLCTATTMTGGKRALKERVVMIAKKPRTALWAVVVVLVAAALAVGATLVGAADTPVLRLAREDILGVSVYDTAKVETDGVWQMNGAEIDEFYSRLSQIRLFLNTDDFDGITPYYSLTVSVKDGDDLLICGYDDGGTMTNILRRGTVYRVPDEEFQQYVRRVCAGETRTVAALDADAPGRWDGAQWDEPDSIFPDRAETPRGFSMPIDLDHDGVQETVEIREVWMDGQPLGATVSVPNSNLTFELSTSHAGWGSVFKYISPDDGRDYLLYYNPNFSTGIGVYLYELYDLTGPVRSGKVEFGVGPMGLLDLDGERMAAFADEINALLEHSTLLACSDGELHLGPASAEPYYETYALPLSIFPYEDEEVEGLTLAERIEYYESAIWADFMKGTLPLFTEDVSQFLWYLSGHDLDWRALWELDSKAALDLIGALRDYVGANELDDASFETLLRRTNGLDGACAGAYNEVLEALWRQDAPRYLRIWSESTEEQQNRAIPYHIHEAVGFAGTGAARARMNESRALGYTEVPEKADNNALSAPAAGTAANLTEIPA